MPSAIPLFLRPPVYKITVLYCFPFAFSIPPLSHVFKAISSLARVHLLPVKAAASQARSRISSGTILHTDLASVKKQLLKTGLLIPFRKSEYLWKKTEQTGTEKIPVRSYEDFHAFLSGRHHCVRTVSDIPPGAGLEEDIPFEAFPVIVR